MVIDNLVPINQPDSYAEHFEEAVSLAASFIRHIIFDLERPAFLVSRSTGGRPSQYGQDYISLMDELAELMPLGHSQDGPGEQGDISGILSEWPSVLVLPTLSCGWASAASTAGVTCVANLPETAGRIATAEATDGI